MADMIKAVRFTLAVAAVALALAVVSVAVSPASAADRPEVSKYIPEPNQKNVDLDIEIKITFYDSLENNTVDEDSVLLWGPDGDQVDCNIICSGKRITVKPEDALEENSRYQLELTEDIEDNEGHSFAGKRYYFYTGSGDSTSLEDDYIDSTDPDSGDKNISTGSKITVYFAQKMDEATVDTDSFYIRKSSSGANVSARVTYAGSSRSATLTPEDNLAAGAEYTAYLTRDVQTADGERIAAYNWRFTTRESSDDSWKDSEYIYSVSPAEDTREIPVDTRIQIKFNCKMDEDSMDNIDLRLAGSNLNIDADIDYDDSSRIAILIPEEELLANTDYTVHLSRDLKTDDGGSAGPVSWSFRTGTAGRKALSVTSRNPAAGAVGIDPATVIRFAFNRDMLADTVTTPGNITLRDASGKILDVFVFYTESAREVLLKPAIPLLRSAGYTVHVAGGIKSAEGEVLEPLEWTFTTAGVVKTARIGTSINPLLRLNGEYVSFPDVQPYTRGVRTYVPMRGLFELIGAEMNWDGVHRKVTAAAAGNTVILNVGKNTAWLNGQETALDAVPEIVNGRVMLPLRFAAEALGASVTWDAKTYTIDINIKF